jgi:hypothetical protein
VKRFEGESVGGVLRVFCLWVLFGVCSVAVNMSRVSFCVECYGGDTLPRSLVMASWSVLIISGLLRRARALSLATRYMLSLGLLALGDFLCIG